MNSAESKAVEKAKEAMNNSYSPYSGLKVGAALICDDDQIYAGTNIENASYGLTICAERAALGCAISAGATKFKSLILISDSEKIFTPCGACLQVLSEFADDLIIICMNNAGDKKQTTLRELFPKSFRL
jgi:cytidine deaminase